MIDQETKSLLHFTGVNNSTIITDEIGKIWTPNGNARILTSEYKINRSSLYLDGFGSWIDTPYSTDHDFGTSDFTIDFWARNDWDPWDIYPWGTPWNYSIFGKSGVFSCSLSYFDTPSNTYNLYFSIVTAGGTITVSKESYTMSVGNWYHFAIVRKYGVNLKLYVNGSLADTETSNKSASVSDNSALFTIGRDGGNAASGFIGYIDEFRISDCARWTTNFNVPNREYGSAQQQIIMSGE